MGRVALLAVLLLATTACDTAAQKAREEAALNGSPVTPAEASAASAAQDPALSNDPAPVPAASAVPQAATADADDDLAAPKNYRLAPLGELPDPSLIECRPDISAEECKAGQAALARDALELVNEARAVCEQAIIAQADASRALATGVIPASLEGMQPAELPGHIQRLRNSIEANCKLL